MTAPESPGSVGPVASYGSAADDGMYGDSGAGSKHRKRGEKELEAAREQAEAKLTRKG